MLDDNVNELMKALRYLEYVVDKGVGSKDVVNLLPNSVTVIVDVVTELSRDINMTISDDTYVDPLIFHLSALHVTRAVG